MPPAASLVSPPDRPAVNNSTISESVTTSNTELTTATPLISPIPPAAPAENLPAQPETKLASPPMMPKVPSRSVNNGISNANRPSDERNGQAQKTAPFVKDSPKEIVKDHGKEPSKDIKDQSQHHETSKAERSNTSKQSLMSVSPPANVKLAKPNAPDRPKPPVPPAAKPLVAPKPPMAKGGGDAKGKLPPRTAHSEPTSEAIAP